MANTNTLVAEIAQAKINVYNDVVTTKDFIKFTTNDGKVRRPTNKFLVFRKNFIKILTIAGISWASEMRKVTSVAQLYWKNASDKQKEPFVGIANEVKANHTTAHPHYTYRPNKKKNEFRPYQYPDENKQQRKNNRKNTTTPNKTTPNKTITEIISPEANTIDAHDNIPSSEDEYIFPHPEDTVINPVLSGSNDLFYGVEYDDFTCLYSSYPCGDNKKTKQQQKNLSLQTPMAASPFDITSGNVFDYQLNLEGNCWFGYDGLLTVDEQLEHTVLTDIDPKSQESGGQLGHVFLVSNDGTFESSIC